MEKDEIKSIINELINFKIISVSQIPDLDLYMDQVTTFVEDRLASYRRSDEDKLLTKTMINNYAKEGLIAPPVRKKYSREHIIRLIMIYHLKSAISIADIGTLLNAIPQDKSLEAYDGFTALQEMEKRLSSEMIGKSLDAMELKGREDRETLLMTVFMLILESNCRRQLAEKLIDKYFKE